jgi:hypothetical protein
LAEGTNNGIFLISLILLLPVVLRDLTIQGPRSMHPFAHLGTDTSPDTPAGDIHPNTHVRRHINFM